MLEAANLADDQHLQNASKSEPDAPQPDCEPDLHHEPMHQSC